MFEKILVSYAEELEGEEGSVLYEYKEVEHVEYEYEVICSHTIEIFYMEEEIQ